MMHHEAVPLFEEWKNAEEERQQEIVKELAAGNWEIVQEGPPLFNHEYPFLAYNSNLSRKKMYDHNSN